MLEEKLEKEKLQRCRVERLLETRERERILNDERRIQYEARCAKMEEEARERARRKHEELEKAKEERERIKKVISDQFSEAAQRNLEREEAAAIQAKVFMEIAAEEQQRLAKVRGEIATEKAKDQYKSSARGIRDEQNQRRVQVRKEAARRAREEAALHRRTQETLEKEQLAAKLDTSAAPTAFNRCLHSDKHIMECQCCQPPASWGIQKSIPLAWGISDMAIRDSPVKVMPLQEVNVANTNNNARNPSASKLSASAAPKKSHQGNTRKMMREDKRRAKLQRKQQVGEGKPDNNKSRSSQGLVGHAFSDRSTEKQNTTTRELMKRDKIRAKRKKRCNGTRVKIFVDDDSVVETERPTKIMARTPKDFNESSTQGDVLDEVVRELMALDGMHDPELERLMTERRELMGDR